tara:strand:- start:3039 stop:3461 length:423 start_codon:yes stop_codon:yes gene_type:complete
MYKILVMGLPGSGKTWLSERMQEHLGCAWFNADKVRSQANDWDFEMEGRIRQANRMRNIADFEKENGRTVICDFVCPTQQARDQFDADITIWLDTIKAGRYEDTNKMFEFPAMVDYKVEKFLTDEEIKDMSDKIRRSMDV